MKMVHPPLSVRIIHLESELATIQGKLCAKKAIEAATLAHMVSLEQENRLLKDEVSDFSSHHCFDADHKQMQVDRRDCQTAALLNMLSAENQTNPMALSEASLSTVLSPQAVGWQQQMVGERNIGTASADKVDRVLLCSANSDGSSNTSHAPYLLR